MSKTRNYKDLEVWVLGRALVKEVYDLAALFPKEEIYCLSQQIRRAAISVPSNIAEGHSRTSTKDYAKFLSMAIGALAEMETQLLLAADRGYIKPSAPAGVMVRIEQLQKKLHSLRKALRFREAESLQSLIPNPHSHLLAA